MVTGIYIPRWGITMEKGLISAWLVQEGQPVTKGQPLLDLETEKITNVIESPADGVLRVILSPAGETPAVGELIAVIAEPEETYDLGSLRHVAPILESTPDMGRTRRAARPAEKTERGRVRASPPARKIAQEYGLDLATIPGTGPEGSISREDVERAITEAVAATLQDGYVTLGDIHMHYIAAGGSQTGLYTSNLTLVLVHGLGGSTMLWQPNLTALATDHRVIAMDLPGHGLSDKPAADYTIDCFAQYLMSFISAMDLSHIVLVGHSLGGEICLKLALEQPHRVERLVLVDAGGLGPEINLDFMQPMLTELSRDTTETMLRGLFLNTEHVTRSMIDATFDLLKQPGAYQALVTATRAAGRDRTGANHLLDSFGKLNLPVLLVWGAQDAVIPLEQARMAQSVIPGARLVLADKAGHCPQLEAAEVFNREVSRFLKQ